MAKLMACKQFVFSFLGCGFFATSHSHHREPLYDWGLKQGSGQVSQIDFCKTGAGVVYGISVQVRILIISHVFLLSKLSRPWAILFCVRTRFL
ncbi:hypothetical protein I7I50_00518 [Histoplasma capsulatum G186AR]|uniref:Secreted protein n=1 Tax=Ajellomyces capsulatus TaxID=5037 RepID=A0A8H8CUV9_AJECA|nr:hypothetical protein I7I52_07786 [Histoplasma capsulatum]QSS72615.1 hypothetical protein I7I50_00518 [Histoplasma capsulatum G186AR]